MAIGCTGGKHRSVAIAEELAKLLNGKAIVGDKRIEATAIHRDLGREL
ncbi:MAG: RNase adapter RapZ [Actinomycetota bacterium]